MTATHTTSPTQWLNAKHVVAFIIFAALWSWGYGGKVRSTQTGLSNLKTKAIIQWAEGQSKTAAEHNNRGIILTREGKLDEAIAAYGAAIAIRKTLLANASETNVANNLAASINNRGIAFRISKNLPAAIEDFNESVRLHTQIVEEAGRDDLAGELAKSLRNRGIAMGDHGDFEQALKDFDKAIGIQQEMVAQSWNTDLAEALAKNHDSRSSIHFRNGYTSKALEDTEAAITLRTRLVDKHGRGELGKALANNLRAVAWIQSTQPEASLRNGSKALAYARRALTLNQGETPAFMTTLAAACAEVGNFPEAIHWQEKALASVQGKNRQLHRNILTLFREGKAYREATKRP